MKQHGPAQKGRGAKIAAILVIAYVIAIAAIILYTPLRIPEILQIAGTVHASPAAAWDWIVRAPGSAPLAYLLQMPFVMLGGPSVIAVRFPSFMFAIASCWLVLLIAQRIRLRTPSLALLFFMLVPVQLFAAVEGSPLEPALFLVLLATLLYFRLLDRPAISAALLYGGVLVLCLYTEPYAYLPSVGYLLALFRFVNRAHERRALWFALPPTAGPLLVYFPYWLWAHPQVNADWQIQTSQAFAAAETYLFGDGALPVEHWMTYGLVLLLAIGASIGAWASIRGSGFVSAKSRALFCCFGGLLVTVLLACSINGLSGEGVGSNELLWTIPGLVLLLAASVEWLLAKKRLWRAVAFALAGGILTLCLACDVTGILQPKQDLKAIAARVGPELKGDSCVVFVSERLSRALFLVFQPSLGNRECVTFFHHRIVLASHPLVRPDQQQDAESYFTGLSFSTVKRIRVGGGQIVVMDQQGDESNPLAGLPR